MRLSPVATFVGTVLLGLPFAVTVGWSLAAPAPHPAPAGTPTGGGGLGSAPLRASTPADPVAPVDWTTPLRAPARRTTPASVPPDEEPASSPSAAGSRSVRPSPTGPPVPTPTDVTGTPVAPSVTPSRSTAEPGPSDLGPSGLVDNP